ncbi:hypothetical protein ACFW1A_15185 [Kitasatospora sp. NPDC058965]|uniref:hypothetical protein n=1 Tax=Kitasatospora sp. NPDC058965 TaxID=3346682 RepID=UPI0036882F3B
MTSSARRRTLLAAPLLTLAALGLAAPAHATGTLPVGVQCSGEGRGLFDCSAVPVGGAGYSYTWTPVYNAWITSGAGTAGILGRCNVDDLVIVSVTVTDHYGNTGTAQGSASCTDISQ